jgi:hypothetical protein
MLHAACNASKCECGITRPRRNGLSVVATVGRSASTSDVVGPELYFLNFHRAGITPAFTCPSLSGPTVINRLWFEFYCTVTTNVTDANARFEVTFLFNGVSAPDVPVFTATAASPRVTLHEKYINGKMGKSVSII